MPVTIDDFEDQDLSEYTIRNGSLSDWSFSIDPVYEGTYALRDEGGTGTSTIYSTGGLEQYFPKGREVHLFARVENTGCIWRFWFAVQDGDNYYSVTLDEGNLVIERVEGGTENFLDSDTSWAWSTDEWARVTVVWDDGTLGGSDGDITVTADLGDNGTIDATASDNDTTSEFQSATGIGFKGADTGGSADHIYWDYAHLPNIMPAMAAGSGSLSGSAFPTVAKLANASGLGALSGSAEATPITATPFAEASGTGTGTGTATLSERQQQFVIGALESEDENDIFAGSNI